MSRKGPHRLKGLRNHVVKEEEASGVEMIIFILAQVGSDDPIGKKNKSKHDEISDARWKKCLW